MRCWKPFQHQSIVVAWLWEKYCFGTRTLSITLPHILKLGHLTARHECHWDWKESQWETALVVSTVWCPEQLSCFDTKTLMGEQAPCPKDNCPKDSPPSATRLLSACSQNELWSSPCCWPQQAEVGAHTGRAAQSPAVVWWSTAWFLYPHVVGKLPLEGCFTLGTA